MHSFWTLELALYSQYGTLQVASEGNKRLAWCSPDFEGLVTMPVAYTFCTLLKAGRLILVYTMEQGQLPTAKKKIPSILSPTYCTYSSIRFADLNKLLRVFGISGTGPSHGFRFLLDWSFPYCTHRRLLLSQNRSWIVASPQGSVLGLSCFTLYFLPQSLT